MDRLDSALKKIKKKKEMKEAAPLAVIGKGLAVTGKAIVKGGAKAAKVGAKAGAKGAKAGGKAVKSGTKVVNPKVMGGEVKKSAQVAKNVKPKSGPTIDVKATEVKDAKKATMSSKSSTPKTKYGKSKGGEIQKSQSDDITNKGKSQVDPQKNPESKPKEEPKEEPKKDDKDKDKKKNGIDAKEKIRDTIKAVKDAYGKSSFTVKEQKTFRDFLEEVSPLLEE